MHIEIDKTAGFCFGVQKTIEKAEEALKQNKTLYCLGKMVHNAREVERLSTAGLVTINHKEFEKLKDATVLIRAHGEPPSTYEIARKNKLTLIDATCPIVSKIQEKIKKTEAANPDHAFVFFGKPTHPEIVGFAGQLNQKAFIVEKEEEIENLPSGKKMQVYSQTTKDKEKYLEMAARIKAQAGTDDDLVQVNNTICNHVAKRKPFMAEFCPQFDMVFFVAGKDSSNGKTLFEHCKQHNPNTFFVEDEKDIDLSQLKNINRIGITGATSTPKWLMAQVKTFLEQNL